MGKVATGSRIDFASVLDRTDLRSRISSELGQPDRSGRWRCPFHDDHNPSLGLIAEGRRFKCWACGAAGDALDWIVRREGISVVEAARKLDPTSPAIRQPSRPSVKPVPPLKLARICGWHDAGWQAAAEDLVVNAEQLLWNKEGRPAFDWLKRRGLADHIISFFRLGFVLEWVQTDPVEVLADKQGKRGIKAPRGITFPWVGPNSAYSGPVEPTPRWAGINVRKLMPNVADAWVGPDKCMAVVGSERGYSYPHCDLASGVPCLITEGEIDALLAFQEIGHLVNVVTAGGAKTQPQRELLSELAGCPYWLIATDHDDAGDEASAEWRARNPAKSRRLQLPHGKDIGEFVQDGGNLREWLLSELDRLGLNLD